MLHSWQERFNSAFYLISFLLPWVQPQESSPSLEANLRTLDLAQCVRQSGWSARRGGKISALNWCLSLCRAGAAGGCSLRLVAFHLGLQGRFTASRNAVCKRLAKGGGKLLECLLAKALALKISPVPMPALASFPRVLIQDSTCLALPKALSGDFPGSSNQSGSAATMRIQACFEMRQGVFAGFKLASFRDNDQGSTLEALELAGRGDLLIRDLGYFALEAFREYMVRGVHLLSRLQLSTKLFDPGTGEEIDLLARLRSRGSMDAEVLAGGRAKVRMRLAAVAVPEKVANERRRRLKAAGGNPTRRHLALLSWQIFLTTVDAETLSLEDIGRIYAMRWRIETLFKSWKSSLGVGSFNPQISAGLARALTYAALLRITLLHARIMPALLGRAAACEASILKFASLAGTMLFAEELQAIDDRTLRENIRKHSLYEKRKRRNMMEQWMSLSSMLPHG